MTDRRNLRVVRIARVARIILLAVTASALALAPAQATQRRAFITSVTGTGNLASWAGATGATVLDKADSVCRARAAAALPTPLPNAGTYRAWLSTSTTDAYCHVQGASGTRFGGCDGFPVTGGGPWYDSTGGYPFSSNLDQMVSFPFAIYAPLALDENHNYVFEKAVLTGTSFFGVAVSGETCSDWTSASFLHSQVGGNSTSTGDLWTGDVPTFCNQLSHLLCVEPGASEPYPHDWTPSALVFVTSAQGSGALGSWPEAEGQGGLAAGDRICRHLATEAHLPAPSSFVAWLSAFPAEAGTRVTTNGPFSRVDGFLVASDHGYLLNGFIPNSLHVDEHGHYLTSPGATWTGTHWDGTASTSTCVAWTDSGSAFDGTIGIATKALGTYWTDRRAAPCDEPARLYCISNQITIFWDGFDLSSDASRWSATVP